MALLAWSPSQCSEGQLLSVSPGESDEGRDVGSTSIVEFFQYNPAGKFIISKSSKLDTVVRSVTWTKHDGGILAFGSNDGCVFFPKLCSFFDETLDDNEIMAQSKSEKQHSGSVSSFDWNTFQTNLVCSGSTDSTVFIWDLNKPNTHMVPGNGSISGSHADPVLTVAWNRQVQHILGTASPSKATIWDLRRSEPVIRLTDGLCRLKPELFCWNPDVATQLLVASTDYVNSQPVIQLWDLKQPTAPIKSLFGHKDGLTSLSWCPQESNLLLTSGKDGSVLLWDPNHGSLLGNIAPETKAYVFESVSWSPRDAGFYIGARNDGILSLHNILSGSHASLGFARTSIARERKASRRDVLDAFDQLDTEMTRELSREDLLEVEESANVPCVVPSKPPKWMISSCKASFSFANRLTFCSVSHGQTVTVNQVVTDEHFLARATEISAVLTEQPHGKKDILAHFTSQRASSCVDADVQLVWKFLDASVSDKRDLHYMSLLGIDEKSIPEKVCNATGRILDNMPTNLGASVATSTMSGYQTSNGGSLNEPIVESTEPYRLPENDVGSSGESLIVESLLIARPELAIDACLHTGRFADALVLSASASQQLFSKTLQYVMRSAKDPVSRLISGICLGDLDSVASYMDVAQWPSCLAIILKYAMDQNLQADLAECLADRLEAAHMFGPAAICHLVSHNISSFSKCVNHRIQERAKYQVSSSTQDLLEHCELILTYVNAVLPKSAQGDIELDDDSVKTLAQYAKLLVEQGQTQLAFEVIKMTPSNKLALLELRHRLYNALNLSPRSTGLPLPSTPFRRVEVKHSPSVISAGRSSAGAENSYSNGYAQSNGVGFQIGGKPIPHQVPASPQQQQQQHPQQQVNLQQQQQHQNQQLYQQQNYSQLQTTPRPYPAPTPPAMSHMYQQQHFVEQINPDSSNVLAPVSMPAQSSQSFYNPNAHVSPAAATAAFQPSSSPYISSNTVPQSSPSPLVNPSAAPPPPLPGHAPQQSQLKPDVNQPPPTVPTDISKLPYQPYNPNAPSSGLQQPYQSQTIPPPPLPGQAPSYQQATQARPQPTATPQPPSHYGNFGPPPIGHGFQQNQQQQRNLGPPPMPNQYQPQNMAPQVPPPSMSGQYPQHGGPASIPPPPLAGQIQQSQQHNSATASVSTPPMNQYYQQQQQQYNVPPPPLPSQFQQQPQQQTQQHYGAPPMMPSTYVMPGSRPQPSYPPPSATPTPYNPMANIPQQQPQQNFQQNPTMFNPSQMVQQHHQSHAPPTHGSNGFPPPPLATVGSAGDMQRASQPLAEHRPPSRAPINAYNPLSVDTAATAHEHSHGELSPTSSVSSHVHDRSVPQVGADLQPIVDALCELFNKSYDAASHGTRKKLEDVDKKMPPLYERLRQRQVSSQVTSHLQQLAAAIRNSDYQNATLVCQHMAGTGQFSEVGQFILPIKLLLHSAAQMNIRM